MENKIFDSLLEPTFVLNQEGIIIYCNETAAALVDLAPKKLIRSKKKYTELFQFENPLKALDGIAEITDSSPYQEIRYTTENGRAGRAQITIQRSSETPTEASSKAKLEWVLFMRDVTLEDTLQKKYRNELEQKEDVIKDLQKARASLEDYSKNLELKVNERTLELSALNGKMQALLDSLKDGFFIFDSEGRCMDISSKACLEIIETNPTGKHIWDVLKLEAHQIPGIQRWMQTCFSEMLPFEDLADLGPKKFHHSKGREIEISYFPLRGPGNEILGIVCVTADITDLVAARHQALTDRAQVNMILSLVKNRRQIKSFVDEAESFIQQIKTEVSTDSIDSDSVFRSLHTLKGSAGILSIKGIVDTCHAGEDILTSFKRTQSKDDLSLLQDLCGLLPSYLEDFKINTLSMIGYSIDRERDTLEIEATALHLFHALLAREAPTLRRPFEETFFFEPIGQSFGHLSDSLKPVANMLDKLIQPVQLHGGDLKIFKEPYTPLFESLIHAFRNSLDHGIETPEVRKQKGKPEAGTLELHFSRSADGNSLSIEIRDDGGGISASILRKRLTEKGFDLSKESDEEVLQHIFDPSVSTRDQVTELSGRGVGMDAIADAVKKLKGNYRVTSEVGKWTSVQIQVPWCIPGVRNLEKKVAA